MRNLTVHQHEIYVICNDSDDKPQEFINSNMVCCSHATRTVYIVESGVVRTLKFTKDPQKGFDKNTIINTSKTTADKPIAVEYCSDNQLFYIAEESGRLLAQKLDSHEIPEAQSIDGGPRCLQLSPDQEILVVVTANDKVITILAADFEVLSEVNLNDDNFGDKQFITVGWGHKATQFHGSEGKRAATAKKEIVGKTERDSGKHCVTWRGDGALFAVSYLNKKMDIRQFKVFNREGELQYTSELTHGLEEIIAWRPSGNYIAATQQLPDKHVVAFFEKNGLKHREFTLPFKPIEVEVKNLIWSEDSDILTIWVKRDDKSIVQLWTVNNYHWYLKQTIEFDEHDDPLLYLQWGSALGDTKKLSLLTMHKFMIYEFRWTINHSRCHETNDKAVVGVIDGDKTLLTGFKVGIVPPPMCHHSLHINWAINECFFAPRCQDDGHTWLNPNSFCLLLQNDQLALCVYEDDNFLSYKHARSYNIEWETADKKLNSNNNNSYSMHHFLWLNENTILFYKSLPSNSLNVNDDYLCVIKMENVSPDQEEGRMVVRDAFKVDDQIHHIVASPTDTNVAYILVQNHVFKYADDEGSVNPTEIIIPESCDQVEVIQIERRHVFVSLSRTNRFFIDGAQRAVNITSFSIHSDFLLLTTLQHALVCVMLNGDSFKRLSMANLEIQPWNNGDIEKDAQSAMGLSMRRLERSSSLIVSILHDSKVILQMKRGNLEAIQPRPLSLHIIKTHLNVLNYFEAFDIMRKQRINLNLIYDHNPTLFINNAEKFVDAIKNSQWLNLFLSELQEEDVTETIYKACYNEQENEYRKSDYEIPEEGKVEFICKLLRGIMEKKACERNLVQPILMTLVKNKHVPGLEAALRRIKEFKSKEGTAEGRQQSADEAFKYLLYFVDVDVLYGVALGMYDLELAKYVASKSQKDPKEYLHYLSELAEMEENWRKFQIDKDLKRYESAVEHLSKRVDKFDVCLEFICEHNLFTKAIRVFPKDQEEYKEVAKVYGQYLYKNKCYREAAVMFQRGEDLEQALQAYKSAGSWQDAIIVSTKMNMSPSELIELYESLVNQLKDDRRYRDAAEVCLNHLQQPEDAVSLLCDGKEWRDALKLAYTSKRSDLIETHVKPGVNQHAIDIYLKIIKNKEEFLKMKKRLLVVRKEKAKQARIFDKLDEENLEKSSRNFSDVLSETSSIAGSTTSLCSNASRSSARTYRSSKNKRKQERKILSVKQGSAYEDLAIIRTLHILVSDTYSQRNEVCSVNRMLLAFDFDELAEKLQNASIEFVNIIEKNKHEIWPKNLAPVELKIDESNIQPPGSLLEPKFTYPPENKSVDWILKIFPVPFGVSEKTFN